MQNLQNENQREHCLDQVTKGNPEKYVVLTKPDHPNSNTQGKIREHVYKASMALGRALKNKEQVHHVDYNPKNNDASNLVICADMKYHKLLHARTDALNVCGNANYMKCAYCGEYDDPKNMYTRSIDYQAWHRECRSKRRRVLNPKTGPYKNGKL